jgi:hypothetical protein
MNFLTFHKQRFYRNALTDGTLKNYYRPIKLFCERHDFTALNWRRISKVLMAAKYSSNDRALTLKDICKLVGYPDRRIKP